MAASGGTLPMSAVAVIVAATPTLTEATVKNPVPVSPGMFTIPSLPRVAASATMSGIGVGAADSRSVLTPGVIGACVCPHAKLSWSSVGGIAAVGVKARTKLWEALPAMLIGVVLTPVG